MMGLTFLSSAKVNHLHRVLHLNVAASNETMFVGQASIEGVIQAATYRQLASVVEQCEMTSKNLHWQVDPFMQVLKKQ